MQHCGYASWAGACALCTGMRAGVLRVCVLCGCDRTHKECASGKRLANAVLWGCISQVRFLSKPILQQLLVLPVCADRNGCCRYRRKHTPVALQWWQSWCSCTCSTCAAMHPLLGELENIRCFLL